MRKKTFADRLNSRNYVATGLTCVTVVERATPFPGSSRGGRRHSHRGGRKLAAADFRDSESACQPLKPKLSHGTPQRRPPSSRMFASPQVRRPNLAEATVFRQRGDDRFLQVAPVEIEASRSEESGRPSATAESRI